MSIDEIVTLFFLKLNTIELNYSQQELIDFGLHSIYSKRKVSEATRGLLRGLFSCITRLTAPRQFSRLPYRRRMLRRLGQYRGTQSVHR